mmetsp:Transcript_29416/g.62609  ORF Transcript_29416/g.62609 Transcript_29416/m.62609 type:complete len:166 (-) Transcript_29416:159-656(-)
MIAHGTSVLSAVVGAALLNGVCLLSAAPFTGAAWGWKQSAPSGAPFTCAEGEVGCGAMPPTCGDEGGCCASNFTCTVTPKAGLESCTMTTITLQCSKAGGAAAQPNTIACINIGGGNHTQDSTLSWSAMPSCSTAATLTTEASGATKVVGSSALLVAISLLTFVV